MGRLVEEWSRKGMQTIGFFYNVNNYSNGYSQWKNNKHSEPEKEGLSMNKNIAIFYLYKGYIKGCENMQLTQSTIG